MSKSADGKSSRSNEKNGPALVDEELSDRHAALSASAFIVEVIYSCHICKHGLLCAFLWRFSCCPPLTHEGHLELGASRMW